MQLSRKTVETIGSQNIIRPSQHLFTLPEKVLQFGTGVLLRGLCDYHIDKANREGRFNGRVVVVKSTSSGDTSAFETQNGLYTICVRGISEGEIINENIISSAISRVLPAATSWPQILALAANPELQIVISNTTETGLQYVEESIHQQPPQSYPARLLAFIYQRYAAFRTQGGGELVIIPTELISENGDKLKVMLQKLSIFNSLENEFIEWMNASCHFCNSLVDRIVTKDPGEKMINEIQESLGYSDELLTMCEDYNLWAIQGNEFVRSVVSFANDPNTAFVAPDIEKYKSLKLHLLNGTHTLSASFAFLVGFKTVKQAMANSQFRDFVEKLMLEEISPAIPSQVSDEEKKKFGKKVIDRFSNPFLEHQWLNITLQNTMKMRMRNLPVLMEYKRLSLEVPLRMATGFAAFLLFMKAVKVEDGAYFGQANGQYYRINDDMAARFYTMWNESPDAASITRQVLSNQEFWGDDLSTFAAFRDAVAGQLESMMKWGPANSVGIKVNV